MTDEKINIFDVDSRTLVKDLTFARLYYINEIDLFEVEYQANCLIDQKEAMQIIQANREFNNSSNRLAMATATKEYFNMTSEARVIFSEQMKLDVGFQKMALVVNNLAYRILSNFFIRFNRPVVPTKVFNSRKKALDWLLE
ncbi:DUF7793 family protein [Acidiluteibacter ferrifornacis]|uniref:DUF7793 domain-containing protein n=1 Tax=Acidiluteibacter ferrifornacis TaxID=2692424 RepID=A0A6N9NMM2_9FLAO|nr:hypothetical protein [Acidiluteibacter ferrifornacis]NBG67213.1 hypothetical protein [Acidiluteibacter ferrifornacis]